MKIGDREASTLNASNAFEFVQTTSVNSTSDWLTMKFDSTSANRHNLCDCLVPKTKEEK